MIEVPDLPLTGGCQCGAVRYRVGAAPLTCYVCHCDTCQRQSGSAFGMSLLIPLAAFEVEGETAHFRRVAASGTASDCYFCPACGTRLWHAREGSDRAALKPGTLDRRDWLRPVAHIWTSERQHWVEIPRDTATYEGQPDMPHLFHLWAGQTT